MDQIIETIQKEFNSRVVVIQKRPGIHQLYLPIYHEDGDIVDLFVTENNGEYILGDYGQTLMRLSYSYDIDTPNKETILQKIITENSLNEENGNIFLKTTPETVFSDIMHVTQVYSKIGSMRYFKREMIESLFYEMLDEFITHELEDFKPQKKVYPIPGNPDIEADYQFSPNGHPVFLFGVKDVSKARLAIITYYELQKAKLNFRGWVVNEDFEKIPRKDRSRMTNICDKQFTSFEDFKITAREFLERERK